MFCLMLKKIIYQGNCLVNIVLDLYLLFHFNRNNNEKQNIFMALSGLIPSVAKHERSLAKEALLHDSYCIIDSVSI